MAATDGRAGARMTAELIMASTKQARRKNEPDSSYFPRLTHVQLDDKRIRRIVRVVGRRTRPHEVCR